MKKIITVFIFIFYSAAAAAQNTTSPADGIVFKLKNNRMLPSKVKLISYEPAETGNDTHVFWLLPGGTKKFKFAAGTKLYLANSKQVGTVMSGARISDELPFLTVSQEDAGKVFDIK
jgi:hypothetical protein